MTSKPIWEKIREIMADVPPEEFERLANATGANLHPAAMALTDAALVLRRATTAVFAEAYRLESEAARACADCRGYEPTRSVLYRSAATLAADCGKLDEAEELALEGLTPNTPAAVAEELRQVLARIRWLREEPKP